MKKIINTFFLVTIAASLSFSVNADAKKKRKKMKAKEKQTMKSEKSWDRPYGLAGCGLGSIVMGKEGNQVLAATTNNIYGLESQLVGISLGTSNCIESKTHDMAQKVDVFVETNKLSLASDMARGEGETVTTLSSMLGCSDSAAFGKLMKSNFSNIYTSEKVHSFNVTDSVINTVLKDKNLSKSCSNLNLG